MRKNISLLSVILSLSLLLVQSALATVDTRLTFISNTYNSPPGQGTLVLDVEASSNDGSSYDINSFQDAFQLDATLRAQNPSVLFSDQLFPSTAYTTTEEYRASDGRVDYVYTYHTGSRGTIPTGWTPVVRVTIQYTMTDATSTITWFTQIPHFYVTDSGDNVTTGSGQTISAKLTDFSLPVQLSSFSAEVGPSFVALSWTTESEEDNLGFHVYRAMQKDSLYTRINDALIPGAPGGYSEDRRMYSYQDPDVVPGHTYLYRLEAVSIQGERTVHGPVSVKVTQDLMVRAVPTMYRLYQNHPNPFNPGTTIAYDLPEARHVSLVIYTLTGQRVATLVSASQEAGHYEVTWDGAKVANGIYLYRLEAETFVDTKRMVIVK